MNSCTRILRTEKFPMAMYPGDNSQIPERPWWLSSGRRRVMAEISKGEASIDVREDSRSGHGR